MVRFCPTLSLVSMPSLLTPPTLSLTRLLAMVRFCPTLSLGCLRLGGGVE